MSDKKRFSKLVVDDTAYETVLTRKFEQRKSYAPKDINSVQAFIPGIIQDIFIKKGQDVKEGDKLLILEAMKMKNSVLAPRDGKVKEIKVVPGQMVTKNFLLVELE